MIGLKKPWIPLSTKDYPGEFASVVFAGYCNMHCRYCHNKAYLVDAPDLSLAEFEAYLAKMQETNKLVKGVVVSGGEPTYLPQIVPIMGLIKKYGFKAKLDTNGLAYGTVMDLLNKGYIDYLAVDIKAPFQHYNIVQQKPLTFEEKQSLLDVIAICNSKYMFDKSEFRTTVWSMITPGMVYEILAMIRDGRLWAIQQRTNSSNTAFLPIKQRPWRWKKKIREYNVSYLEFRGWENVEHVNEMRFMDGRRHSWERFW